MGIIFTIKSRLGSRQEQPVRCVIFIYKGLDSLISYLGFLHEKLGNHFDKTHHSSWPI